jgi:hypothetical protein
MAAIDRPKVGAKEAIIQNALTYVTAVAHLFGWGELNKLLLTGSLPHVGRKSLF